MNMHNIYLTGLFLATAILFSCNKDKGLPAPAPTYYFDSKVNSKSLLYEDSLKGILNTAEKTGIDFGTYTLIKESSIFSGTSIITGVAVNTIISHYMKGCTRDTAFIDSMFTVKSYSFTNSLQNEGIEISWYDGTQMWSSSNGTADQTGSSFKIVKHEYVGKPDHRYISSGNFNCKIYSADGNVKFMTGNFKVKTNEIN
ncbi:MAG TPA: hypothetical protein VNW99_02150 [Cytophagaceae bacterium]|nr:hypothetical protein [Cytophagaceae bacterium]